MIYFTHEVANKKKVFTFTFFRGHVLCIKDNPFHSLSTSTHLKFVSEMRMVVDASEGKIWAQRAEFREN